MPDDLRMLRKQLGLTQAELAALLGISRKQLHESETGKVAVRPERLMAVQYLLLSELPPETESGCSSNS